MIIPIGTVCLDDGLCGSNARRPDRAISSGLPTIRTNKGGMIQDVSIGMLRSGRRTSRSKRTKLSERSGIPTNDPLSGRHPTSHEPMTGLLRFDSPQ
jgi:hypothetical protein